MTLVLKPMGSLANIEIALDKVEIWTLQWNTVTTTGLKP